MENVGLGERARTSDDPLFTTDNGMRAVSSNVRGADGSMSRVISIGVPRDHPLADLDSPAGPSGLHNLRIGPIRLPVAPTFVIRVRRARPPGSSSTGEVFSAEATASPDLLLNTDN